MKDSMNDLGQGSILTIHTDGACDPNPGPGGYGVVILDEGSRIEYFQGFSLTTNNRMELMGPIVALQALGDRRKVRIVSDSKYVVNGVARRWAYKWRDAKWVGKAGRKVPNHDLWARLLDLLDAHEVDFEWTKGHSSNSLNNRADALSYKAIEGNDLVEDEGYLTSLEDRKLNSRKITTVGQPCKKCRSPVIKKRPKRKLKSDQKFYFEYYLICPSCNTIYMVESAKRLLDKISRATT